MEITAAVCVMCEKEVEFEHMAADSDFHSILHEINIKEKCIYDINKNKHIWLLGNKPWFRCPQCGDLSDGYVTQKDGRKTCSRCEYNNTSGDNKTKEKWYKLIGGLS